MTSGEPPKTNIPQSGDHRAWALHWGDQFVASVRFIERHAGEVGPSHPAVEHAIRSARLAFWHAARVKKYEYWKGEPK